MSGFVKIDCGILRSTLWMDKPARDMFMTALFLAEPREFSQPVEQIAVDALEVTGWSAPAGWYGFVAASGPGIAHEAQVDWEHAKPALIRLGNPETDSRSKDFDGRRLIRIDGGYLVLNYMKYRERDYTNRDRQRRWRERNGVMSRRNGVMSRSVTQAEAEAEAEERETPPPVEPPPPARVPALWDAYRWLSLFGKCWCEKYQTPAGPGGGAAAAKATGDLSDQLSALDRGARLAAQARAPAMFAEFLADESPKLIQARHPWAFFVTAFNGLRVPAAQPRGSPGGGAPGPAYPKL